MKIVDTTVRFEPMKAPYKIRRMRRRFVRESAQRIQRESAIRAARHAA